MAPPLFCLPQSAFGHKMLPQKLELVQPTFLRFYRLKYHAFMHGRVTWGYRKSNHGPSLHGANFLVSPSLLTSYTHEPPDRCRDRQPRVARCVQFLQFFISQNQQVCTFILFLPSVHFVISLKHLVYRSNELELFEKHKKTVNFLNPSNM